MAKKSTWEKRASKVKKEEHIVLGGNTNRKKHGVKKKYTTSKDGEGYKGGGEGKPKPSYTITREGDGDKKPGAGRSDRQGHYR